MDHQPHGGGARMGAPSRSREALDRAWHEANGADSCDAAGRPGDRDVRLAFAIVWALIAIGESRSE